MCLCDLARVAELCTDCRDRRIVAIIQAGLKDWEVAMRLSEHDGFPTLAETIDFCRKAETAQRSNLKSSQSFIRKTSKQPPKSRASSESCSQDTCSRCGYARHREHQRCPALNETCSFCSKQKAVCRRKKTHDGKKIASENHVDPNIRKIETNKFQSVSTRRCPKIKLNCQVPDT